MVALIRGPSRPSSRRVHQRHRQLRPWQIPTEQKDQSSPHVPQWSGLLMSDVSQPLPRLPSQSPQPNSHSKMHSPVPGSQVAVAFVESHGVLQQTFLIQTFDWQSVGTSHEAPAARLHAVAPHVCGAQLRCSGGQLPFPSQDARRISSEYVDHTRG
jgi:hypothetical protein